MRKMDQSLRFLLILLWDLLKKPKFLVLSSNLSLNISSVPKICMYIYVIPIWLEIDLEDLWKILFLICKKRTEALAKFYLPDHVEPLGLPYLNLFKTLWSLTLRTRWVLIPMKTWSFWRTRFQNMSENTHKLHGPLKKYSTNRLNKRFKYWTHVNYLYFGPYSRSEFFRNFKFSSEKSSYTT